MSEEQEKEVDPRVDGQCAVSAVLPQRAEEGNSSMRSILVVIAAVLFVGACVPSEPPPASAQARSEGSVGLLFEHEGVRVYRFVDGGRYHYYAVPRSGAQSVLFSEWSQSCGKSCTETIVDETPTVARR